MTQVALLPMKANSERVRGKNFRDLAGKPLFRWMLDSLLSLESIDKVVVNTDARAILRENGLEESDRVMVRDRHEALQGDMVSMNRIIEDDIAAVPADLYLMTHTTNPLLSAATARDAMNQFLAASERYDSLFTVNRIQTRFYREDGSAVNHDPNVLLRTQDLEPWLEENSCLYLFTRESFARTGARIGAAPMMYETPKLESVDIDEPEDWIMAEALARYGLEQH
ncbi:acylneuraminate cytidylyltransferase family protein [Aquisalimonas lutea]|uniref:acylneuraminate cytidylyltransferase family protein n=1 Tax=Aquisalimonas lutea TaxID=1327750 RepID=UPI0025B2E4AB|nr:acylneuraminate cytidylyltransferase family protein [Aquisalimonas lutea]MDN3517818.1 acylneuraminate cytidylyltransferase family protein [Aquisalimonas lutea]